MENKSVRESREVRPQSVDSEVTIGKGDCVLAIVHSRHLGAHFRVGC